MDAIGLFLAYFIALGNAQQPGVNTPEVHPKLPTHKCTSRGCVTVNSSIVLDAAFRWLHKVGSNTNCISGEFDPSICPDPESCVKNCALEGVDYSKNGLKTAGNAVTLNLFKKENSKISRISPRIYLYDESQEQYAVFKLLNQEFTFDVDMSKAPCGVNGALYFSEMSPTGHRDAINRAGAKYGVGYCDAQCPKDNFINGRANINKTHGACCAEMDIWEASSAATAFTPHPCNITGVYSCTEPMCGNANRYGGVCDKDGCDFNAYRNGDKKRYGRGADKRIDTTKPFTVVTQFITANRSPTGVLTHIRRLYIQNGKKIPEGRVAVKGIDPVNMMTDQYCNVQKAVFGGSSGPNAFKTQGGLRQMGEAMKRGMVLAMSIWVDGGGYMQWLDGTFPVGGNKSSPGVERGPCSSTAGMPDRIERESSDAAVVFSNIRTGDIGTTYR